MDDEKEGRVEAFLAALHDAMNRHDGFWRHGCMGVFPAQERLGTVEEMRGDVDLDSLSADHPGRRWASAAMLVMTALADFHGVSVYLVANADDEEAGSDDVLDQGALEAFYARHGFSFVGPSWGACTHMRRAPFELTEERRKEIEAVLRAEPVWLGDPNAAADEALSTGPGN